MNPLAKSKLRLYVGYWVRTPSETCKEIFHTGLLLMPKNPRNDEPTTARYHAVNGIDRETELETWMFESKLNILPRRPSLSGLMLLGKVPSEFTAERIEEILRTVRVPTREEIAAIEKGGNTWRCGDWVADALSVLVAAGVIPALPDSPAEVVKKGGEFIKDKTNGGSPVHSERLFTCDTSGTGTDREVKPLV